jgi:type IV pilus assembly protein PilC
MTNKKTAHKGSYLFSNYKKERQYLLDNVGSMLASGMSILPVLDALRPDIKSPKLLKFIDQIYEDVDNGSTIWQAFEKSKILSSHLISLIRVGEESGRLAENLKIVLDQQQRDLEFRSKIKSSLSYPVFVLVVMTIVGSIVAIFVIPKLSSIYTGLNTELPWITKAFIALGGFLDRFGTILIAVGDILLTAFYIVLFKYSKTKFIGQNLLLRLPVIKNLIKEIEISRFGFLLGTLIKAGLPINFALDSLYNSSNFAPYKKFYNHLRESINDGEDFKTSFENYKGSNKLFSRAIINMIASAEKSSNIDEVFLKVGEIYEKKNDITSKTISIILEPILLIIVWIGVTVLALSIVLPIYSFVGNLDNAGQQTATPVTNTPSPTVTSSIVSTTTITPTVTTTSKVTITLTPTVVVIPGQSVKINPLEAGYISLRSQPNTTSAKIGKANQKETYPYIEKQNGWYKIVLPDGTQGWISGQYLKEVKI